GVQGATESTAVVIITRFTAMFFGAVFLGAGSYPFSSAGKENFDKGLRRAAGGGGKETYFAAEGLVKALNEEGLAREQSYSIVKVLRAKSMHFLELSRKKSSAWDRRKLTGLSRCIGHGGFVHGWSFGTDRTLPADHRTNRFISLDCAIG